MFFPKQVMASTVKGVVVEAVDVGNQFENEQEFEFGDHMVQCIRTKASELGFGVVIRRFGTGSDWRYAL